MASSSDAPSGSVADVNVSKSGASVSRQVGRRLRPTVAAVGRSGSCAVCRSGSGERR